METCNSTNTRYINYVIVVHGIGDQRTNETVMPVINRFAEVRQDAKAPQKREVVTLGMVTSQTGKPEEVDGKKTFSSCFPWSEFENIPQEPYPRLPPFLGSPSFTGENIRFVDMHWADIMEKDFKDVGQKTGDWAKSLLGRLETKAMPDGDGVFKGSKEEAWILPILYQLEETLIFLDNMLALKFPFIDELIFNKFLGDIQLYGEYQLIRGKAVRRFHNLMEKIEREHIKQFTPENLGKEDDMRYFSQYENQYIKPKYIILSHSLGTVMSMDALMYGHLSKEIYEFPGKYSNLPFPGYANQYEKVNEHNLPEDSYRWIRQNCKNYLGERWIDNVDSFVTLGSPIDKFLTIWWQNYTYLGKDKGEFSKRGDTIDQIFKNRDELKKIKHYNYCDEQDPVGHQLDKFTEKKVYDFVFQKEEDIVFNRYATPGVAHVKYWEDIDLFKRIVRLVVDKEPKIHLENSGDFENFEYKKGTYNQVLFYIYGFLQLISVFLTSFFAVWGFETRDWKTSVIGSVGLIGTVYLLRKFIKLSIWWRQVLKSKAASKRTDKYKLEASAARFRWLMKFISIVLILLDLTYIPTRYWFVNQDINWKDVIHYMSYFRDLMLIGAIGVVLHYLLYTKKRTGAGMKIWSLPEFRTFLGSLLVFGLGCAITIYQTRPFMLQFIPYQNFYNNFVTIVLITSTITWFYTMACHRVARKTVVLRKKEK